MICVKDGTMHLNGRFPLATPKMGNARSEVIREGFKLDEYDPVAEILMIGGDNCSVDGFLVSSLNA